MSAALLEYSLRYQQQGHRGRPCGFCSQDEGGGNNLILRWFTDGVIGKWGSEFMSEITREKNCRGLPGRVGGN